MVLAFREAGLSIKAIARQLNLDCATVTRVLAVGPVSARRNKKRASSLEHSRGICCGVWPKAARTQNAAVLYAELRALGFVGSIRIVRRWLELRRGQKGALVPAVLRPLVKTLVWLLLREPDAVRDHEWQVLDVLLPSFPEVACLRRLALGFRRVLFGDGNHLDGCSRRSRRVGCALTEFARGLRVEWAALRAACWLS